uniref:Uncharacterized protein n=1 Tax=Anguilla anguilla TaxID=7936 RepID=A0A0E9TGW8_ANGAN
MRGGRLDANAATLGCQSDLRQVTQQRNSPEEERPLLWMFHDKWNIHKQKSTPKETGSLGNRREN